MTLAQLFGQINANYNTVKSLTNAIYTPYRTAIDTHWGAAEVYEKGIKYGVYYTAGNFKENVWWYSREILYLLEDFVTEMFLTAASTKGKLQSIFNTYMGNVVSNVKSAVQLVQTEMYNEVDFLADVVDSSILDLQDYLDAEVNAMHAEIDLLSIDVITWIDAAVANLADTLMGRIEEVNTNLTARVDFLETWTQGMFQAIYDYVDIRNSEMLSYINEANNTLYFYINNRVKELDNYINEVQNSLHSRIAMEVNALNRDMQALEISVTDMINDLITTTGWNFTFFDLFTFRPELSLLRVLLRPDTEFKRYKPYWQALFAKVLEED